MDNPTEEKLLIKQFIEKIYGTPPEIALEYLTRRKWNLQDAMAKYLEDIIDQSESPEKSITIYDSSSSSSRFDPTLSLNEAAESLALMGLSQTKESRISDQEKEKLINTFCGITDGAPRGEAIACLNLCDWDVDGAANYFLGQDSLEKEVVNRGYLKDGKIRRSSTSSVIADLTKTGKPFKEAGPGIVTSQVDKNGKPEAVDEDSSIETGSDPLASQDRSITTKITFLVVLDDGGKEIEVYMTFRSDETLRDIRNRIAQFSLPDDNRGYYLTSRGDTTEIYDDSNTTVQRIYSRGATELLQVFPDS